MRTDREADKCDEANSRFFAILLKCVTRHIQSDSNKKFQLKLTKYKIALSRSVAVFISCSIRCLFHASCQPRYPINVAARTHVRWKNNGNWQVVILK
jgi:hypothetical protein